MATNLDRGRTSRTKSKAVPAKLSDSKKNGQAVQAVQGSFIHDTLVNLVTGLGTNRDKLAHAQYALTVFTQPQLEAAYRSDWIARKIVDLPAKDATREWRAWQAEDSQIELLEEVEKQLKVQRKTRQTMVRASLYGGAAIIMGIDGTGDFSAELDLDKVKKDSLKFLHVVNKFEIGHDQLEQDIMSPWYDLPKQYTYSTQTGGMLRIHPSRVIRMIGPEIPSRMAAPDAWGDSILQIVNDAIIAAASVAGGIANLVEESKNDILKIPGLSENLGTAEYENRLTQRVAMAAQLKAILRTTVIDSEEELERLTASFASLPDIMEVYMMIASGAADIPATRMLGQSPRGLNATGESDIRNYYDRIASDQATELQPVLDTLDEVIIRSALGSRPPEVHYTWNPLWQNSPEQKADIAKKEAEAVKVDLDMGLINPDVLREVRLNMMTESGFYPGIEDAVAKFGAEPEEPEVDEDAIAALVTQQQQAQKTRNMLPTQEEFGGKPKLKVVGDAGFNPNQPRNEQGEWTAGAGGARTYTATAVPKNLHKLSLQQQQAAFRKAEGGIWTTGGGKFSEREEEAIDDFVGASEYINKALRKGSKLDADQRKTASAFDRMINRSSMGRDSIVWRGFDGDKIAKEFAKAVGKDIELRGYTSTSKDKDVIKSFGKYWMEIFIPKGKKALDLSRHNPGEREIVLPHRTRFRVISVDGKRIRVRVL